MCIYGECLPNINVNTQQHMTENFLKMKPAPQRRQVTVKNISTTTIPSSEGGTRTKIVFEVFDAVAQRTFSVSDVYVEVTSTNDTSFKIKGLWFPEDQKATEFPAGSSVVKLLNYYNVETLGDLLNKKVFVYPDNKNFLVLVACNIEDNKDTKDN